MRFFLYRLTFIWNVFLLEEVKYKLFLLYFIQILIFHRFFKSLKYQISWKSFQRETDRQADG